MQKSNFVATPTDLQHIAFTNKINGFLCSLHNQDKECKNNRLCCVQCVDEYHMEHKLISIKKFGVLYSKYGISQEGYKELQNMISAIKIQFHQRVDQFFKSVSGLIDCKAIHIDQKNLQEQQLIGSLNLLAESHLWSFLLQSQKQKVQPENIRKIVSQKFSQLKEMVFNQFKSQSHSFKDNMEQLRNNMDYCLKHWDFGKKGQESTKKTDSKESDLKKETSSPAQKKLSQQRLWNQKAKARKAYIDDLMD